MLAECPVVAATLEAVWGERCGHQVQWTDGQGSSRLLNLVARRCGEEHSKKGGEINSDEHGRTDLDGWQDRALRAAVWMGKRAGCRKRDATAATHSSTLPA